MSPIEKLIEYRNILVTQKQDAEIMDKLEYSYFLDTKLNTVKTCIELLEND